jgi:hypothetical protein
LVIAVAAVPFPPHPIWLTAAELAERWRMTSRTLDRWRVGGYGPAWHVIGGRILYRLEDIEDFEHRGRRGQA